MLIRTRRAVLVLLAAAATASIFAPAASAVVRTNLALAPHAMTVRWDTPVHVAAHLSGPTGPMSGTPVSLWARVASRPWERLATVDTDGHGDVAVTRALRQTTQIQARYAGDAVYDASESATTTITVRPRRRPVSPFGLRVVREAARHRGAPYEYGASGPYRFDCSGFTRYVFGRFHISLPHNAAAQWDRARRVPRSRKQPGDLVFFYGWGGIYHVGIYAGHGRMWAATHTGDVVRLESIYSASYVVGRVR
jgi:peptidoglycan DL-endopeptidase CwlO